MFTCSSERKVVPWYCKAEWNDVFEKTYSDDIALKNEAYERMCLWKVRCPKLPVGVECTMEILQIHLLEKKCDEFSKSLQLMFSTTLMRFINQITHLFSNKLNRNASCYEVAKACGIPDWIVNLRHDVAHKNTLPSMELLNVASDFALEWLYCNYWVVEAKESEDLVIEKSLFELKTVRAERKIKMLLNLWQACKLYKLANIHTVGDVPNSCLRSCLYSFQKEDNILNVVDTDIPDDIFRNSVTLETYLTNDGTSEESSLKISQVLRFLLLYLKQLLVQNPGNENNTKNIFTLSLIECQLFLPVSYNHDFYSNGNQICGSLSFLWRDVLELYHNSHLMTDIMSELAEISISDNMRSRQLVAACWLSHITESLCSPVPLTGIPQKCLEKFAIMFLKKDEGLSDPDEIRIIQSEPVLLNLNLSKQISVKFHDLENLVNKVIMKPNQYTNLYISSLLNLLNPPLDPSAKTKILELVDVYTSKNLCEPSSDIIYTPDMLPGSSNMVLDDNTEEKCEQDIPVLESIWTKKYGIYDWSSCPLGRLPSCSERN